MVAADYVCAVGAVAKATAQDATQRGLLARGDRLPAATLALHCLFSALADHWSCKGPGELEPLAARENINESSREFTKRYADCVQVAKQLANEKGVVPLRRLASSKESWAAAELMAALQGSSLPDDFVPDSQSG